VPRCDWLKLYEPSPHRAEAPRGGLPSAVRVGDGTQCPRELTYPLPVCCPAASTARVELALVRELVDGGRVVEAALPAVDRVPLGGGVTELKRELDRWLCADVRPLPL
jgi:hypothetical protein